MPIPYWIRAPIGATIEADGVVRLSDGRTFNLSSVPGNGFNAQRLAKINEALQAFADKRVLRTSLPADDPDRTANPGLPHLYWSDDQGVPSATGAYLTRRPVRVSLLMLNGKLTPFVEEVV